MRKFWVLATLLVVNIVMAGSVAADSNALQVTVHASVPPACYIVLAADNQISEIITNSQQMVVPQVYYGNISPAHKRHLTAALYTKYLLLMKRHHNQVGIVYQFSPHNMNAQNLVADVAYNPPINLGHHLFFLKSVGSVWHA